MAKAHITTKDGTTILIEGTTEEVAALMARYDGQTSAQLPLKEASKPLVAKKVGGKAKRGARPKVGPASLIAEMISGSTFKKPKTLSEIQKELVQSGHYYPDASIAVALLRAVKARSLRRLKQGDGWAYVV